MLPDPHIPPLSDRMTNTCEKNTFAKRPMAKFRHISANSRDYINKSIWNRKNNKNEFFLRFTDKNNLPGKALLYLDDDMSKHMNMVTWIESYEKDILLQAIPKRITQVMEVMNLGAFNRYSKLLVALWYSR